MAATALKIVFALYLPIACGKSFNFFVFRNAQEKRACFQRPFCFEKKEEFPLSTNVAELLSPAGDFERLRAAFRYGADAVYLAGHVFGMRSASPNFSFEEMCEASRLAHELGKKVYVTCNTLPRGDELSQLPGYLESCEAAGVDALIISDMGVLRMAKKYAPKTEIHISTQTGVVNAEAACMFHELGASRVVLAREMTLDEIREIRANTPKELEIEAFVHGAMCVSFSGRCLLSNYFTGRDGNRGECAQPCRWKYSLMEETRPGRYMPIEETGEGTFILNSRDLCMAEHIPELLEAGIYSLKIEGRAKADYYVASVTKAYRGALDAALEGRPLPEWVMPELDKISHRSYGTGFYFDRGGPGQDSERGGYVRDWEVAAVCMGMVDDTHVRLSQRNRFFSGEPLDVLCPQEEPFVVVLEDMKNSEGEAIEAAPHATMEVIAKVSHPIPAGAYLRRRRGEKNVLETV